MKNKFLTLSLTLIIVLSSFLSVSAETVYILDPDNGPKHIFWNTPNSDYTIYKADGTVLVNVSGTVKSAVGFSTWENDPYFVQYNLNNTSGANYWQFGFPVCISNTGFIPLGERDPDAIVISGGAILENPDIRTVSINPSQMLVINYSDSNKSSFLKSLRVTPNKGIILQQGYYLDGDLSSLAIRKDTSGFLAGGIFNQEALNLSDFPSPRTLNNNEYLAFFQSYDNLGLFPNTNAKQLAYFELDVKICSYKIIDRFTGIVSEGVTSPNTSTPGDITVSSDGHSGITPDYELDRGDFGDGILGTIQYIISDFVNMISSLFTLGLSSISTLVSNGSAFMGSILSMFSWLPSPVALVIQSGLIILVIIGVFKMFL